MLTAGHVIQSLEAGMSGRVVPAVGVFHPETFQQVGIRVVETELLQADLGVLRVEFLKEEQVHWLFPLHWSSEPLGLGAPVRTPGYAYGDYHVLNERQIVQRSFQGSVVADFGRYLPLGMSGEPFSAYELSFAVPRGHSGAPLLRTDGRVVGIVIGNSSSRMLILDSEEVSTDGKTTTLVEQYESLTLGIAVQARAALTQHSVLLAATVHDFLYSRGILH